MNTVALRKYQQSALVIEISGKPHERFVFDLGAEVPLETVDGLRPADALFISHQHPDHFSVDAVRRLAASVTYGPPDVSDLANEQGVPMRSIDPECSITIGSLTLTAFVADHGPNISAPIDNFGFLLAVGGRHILYAGDMAVASGPQQSDADLVLVPVGGSKVFAPHEAIEYLRLIRHRGIVVPIHYHGRSDRESGKKFRDLAGDEFDVRVLDVGEALQL